MTTIDKIRLFERDAGRLMVASLVVSVLASMAAVALSQTRLRPWAATCGAVAGMGVLSAGAALHLQRLGQHRRYVLLGLGVDRGAEIFVLALEDRAKWTRYVAFAVTIAAFTLGASLGGKKIISETNTWAFLGIGGMGLLGMGGSWHLQKRGFDVVEQAFIEIPPPLPTVERR